MRDSSATGPQAALDLSQASVLVVDDHAAARE